MYKVFRRPFLLFPLLTGSLVSCTRRQPPAPPAEVVTHFLAQLDSVKTLEPDTLRSIALRELYNSTPPQLRPLILKPFLKVSSDLLFFHTDADSGLLPFYRSLVADAQLGNSNRAAAGLQLSSFYAHITGETDSAAFYLTQTERIAHPLNDTFQAKKWAVQAQIAQLNGDLKGAASHLYKSIQYAEKAGDSGTAARVRGNRANIYRLLEDYRQAIVERRWALSYFRAVADSPNQMAAAGGLAADYTSLKEMDSAQHYFEEADMLVAAGVQNPVAEYYLYLTQGGRYITLRNYDSAIYYFEKAAPFATAFGDEGIEMTYVITSAMAYAFRRNVLPEAERIANYIPTLLADSNLPAARDAFYSLYLISTQQPAAGNALDYYQLYDSLRMVLSDAQNQSHVAKLEARYDLEKKNLTIELQQREIKQKGTLNGVLALSVLVIVLAAAIIINRILLQRSRQKALLQQQFTTEMLKSTEAERGRIAADLHDGISHELLSLKNNLHRQMADNEARIDAIINDVRMLSRNLHPIMLDKIGLEYSVHHLCEQIMAGGQLFASADIEYARQLPPEGELQLYRIIQESLTNAVKYAQALAAKVRIVTQPGLMRVTIMDNGRGFEVAEKLASKTAFGLHSILARSQALGGNATFTSGEGGTTISVEIPLS